MVDRGSSAQDRVLIGAGFDTSGGSPFVQARLGLLGKTVFLLAFEAVMLLVATAVFWMFSRELTTWPRIFVTLGTLVPQTVIALTMAFFSLLMLNR